jgi:hypothetical protein
MSTDLRPKHGNGQDAPKAASDLGRTRNAVTTPLRVRLRDVVRRPILPHHRYIQLKIAREQDSKWINPHQPSP